MAATRARRLLNVVESDNRFGNSQGSLKLLKILTDRAGRQIVDCLCPLIGATQIKSTRFASHRLPQCRDQMGQDGISEAGLRHIDVVLGRYARLCTSEPNID